MGEVVKLCERQRVQSSNTAPLCLDGTLPPDVTVDWLTVVQDHSQAPLVGKSLLLFVDPATGSIESQAVKSLHHEGSYDSKLLIRSDGRRVEVSGNPSRWGVPHSLHGFGDVESALGLYCSVLRAVGLPEFTRDERGILGSDQWLQRTDRIFQEGCRITRVDLASLYETGSAEDAAIVVRALGQVTHAGKCPMVYGNGETVAWGSGSRHVYVKYYSKGPEMLRHGGPDALAAAKWATKAGIVRHEVTLKSMFLSRHGLDCPNAWTVTAMRTLMERYAMHSRLGVSRMSFQNVYEQLVALGVPECRARRAQEAAYAYLGGHVFRKGGNIPVRSFYRLRADLRRVGLDISSPLNVSALRYSVRTVELRPAALPLQFRRSG